MNLRVTTIAVTLLLLLGAQGAQAQEETEEERQAIEDEPGVPITFYGHVFNNGRANPMPLNTQYPAGEEDYSIGLGGGCGAAPPQPDDSADCESWAGNEEFFYTTAGFVQVKSREEFLNNGGYEQLHNERGQTKDIFFDTSQPVTASLYMSADFHGWPVFACAYMCWNWDPGYFEDWVVEAWLWKAPLGDHGSAASEAPNMGEIANRQLGTLMAHGKTEPTDLISFDETIPADALCGGPCTTVQEFPVELAWDDGFTSSGGIVPKEEDFILEFEWYQETDGQKYIRGSGPVGIVWNLNGGEDYPNRLTLPVRNPLDVELVFPKFVHDKLVILSVINTPWGSYDVDQAATTLTVTDADGREVSIQEGTLTGGLDRSVSHAGHYRPIEGTWVWDYQAQDLAPGSYSVTVETTNFQHSYTTATTADFTITAEGTGGDTRSGRSGLQSFQEDVTEGVGSAVEGEETEQELDAATGEDKDSPAPGLFLVTGLLVAVAARRWLG